MITSFKHSHRSSLAGALLTGGLILALSSPHGFGQKADPNAAPTRADTPAKAPVSTQKAADSAPENDLAQQIFETMLKVPGTTAGHRVVHPKGIVCTGAFVASSEAGALSKARHFHAASVPVTVRFSNGGTNPHVPDYSPEAGPRGMAIRFHLPGGGATDIVSMSHNGFVVATPEEFLALQQAVVATDPVKPHPWPIEAFLASHPPALKFVQESQIVPASFATEAFFSNDAFVFVDQGGKEQPGRYKVLPIAGQQHLTEAEAKSQTADFLQRELRSRLLAGPVKYRLLVQLPNPGDVTRDPSLVWPEDRRTIDLGVISINTVVTNSEAAERDLAYNPAKLADGIELSDDPLPALRESVYAHSVKHRRQTTVRP